MRPAAPASQGYPYSQSPIRIGMPQSPMRPVGHSMSDRNLVLALVLGVVIGGMSSGLGALAAPPFDSQALCPPAVILATPTLGAVFVTVDVADTHPMCPLVDFSARLFQNNVANGTLEPLFDGATDGALSFSDRSGDGRFSGGDQFLVVSTWPGTYELLVFYRGDRIAQSAWIL